APPTLDVSLTNRAAPTDHYPLSLHDALPICGKRGRNEQEAPGPAELDHEHVPERDRDEEPRGPEEIEEDHVSPAVLRRQVFRQEIGRSTRLNSSHVSISYAVFCLKKKKKNY